MSTSSVSPGHLGTVAFRTVVGTSQCKRFELRNPYSMAATLRGVSIHTDRHSNPRLSPPSLSSSSSSSSALSAATAHHHPSPHTPTMHAPGPAAPLPLTAYDAFFLTSCPRIPAPISPSGVLLFEVAFEPEAKGAYSGVLALQFDHAQHVVWLSGSGVHEHPLDLHVLDDAAQPSPSPIPAMHRMATHHPPSTHSHSHSHSQSSRSRSRVHYEDDAPEQQKDEEEEEEEGSIVDAFVSNIHHSPSTSIAHPSNTSSASTTTGGERRKVKEYHHFHHFVSNS